MTDFSLIPERSNNSDIDASWWNTIRTFLINFTDAPSFISYANDAAFVSAKGSAAGEGDHYFNSTIKTVRFYNGTNWVSVESREKITTESIAASGAITINTISTKQTVRVAGDSGAQDANIVPFGAAGGWVDQTVVTLIGTDSTNTLKLTHNDNAKGAILNGSIVLIKYQLITLKYDSTLDRWIEQSRNL